MKSTLVVATATGQLITHILNWKPNNKFHLNSFESEFANVVKLEEMKFEALQPMECNEIWKCILLNSLVCNSS